MLCTSGFEIDVTFSHNGAKGPESNTTGMFRRVLQMAAPGAKLLSTIAGFFAKQHHNIGYYSIELHSLLLHSYV